MSDALGVQDAAAIYRFLVGRGYITGLVPEVQQRLPGAPLQLLHDATPLSGTDSVIVESAGVVTWLVELGDTVQCGQVVGEIVNIEDVDAVRVPIRAKCSGLVLTKTANQLCRPGQRMMKIVGKEPLDYRQGNLLSL